MRRCCVVRALHQPPPPARRAQSIARKGGGMDGMVRPPVRGGEGPRLRVATAIARGEPHLMVRMLCSMTRVWKSLWRSSSLSLSNEPSDVDESRNLRQGVRCQETCFWAYRLHLFHARRTGPVQSNEIGPSQSRRGCGRVPAQMWTTKAYICFRTTHGAISAVRKYLVDQTESQSQIAAPSARGCLRKATSTRAGACA